MNTKIKITRVQIKGESGDYIMKPRNTILEKDNIEEYRTSLKRDDSDIVLFNYEEVED